MTRLAWLTDVQLNFVPWFRLGAPVSRRSGGRRRTPCSSAAATPVRHPTSWGTSLASAAGSV